MTARQNRESLAAAFKHALSGIAHTVSHERNIKIELVIAVLALVASSLLQLEPLEWAAIIILIVLVLALELANSALESLTNLASPAEHPLAKQAKDAMAGAVLVVAVGAAASGLIIFVAAALRLGVA
ncbi:MAG: diacylglycerol kinase family protein [Coriobacteriales bacterium]|jgi:diacylglycerol kinase|nr:diacylglycerol kinase family protein [Coriobacteriales bacterium]